MVGVGPWGLANLERLWMGGEGARSLHVIEPGVPGSGNFSVDDPDYLPLNTPCGQHVMHPATVQSDMPAYAQSLFAWARRRGYRWVGDECRITTEGHELSPNDFCPVDSWENGLTGHITRSWPNAPGRCRYDIMLLLLSTSRRSMDENSSTWRMDAPYW